MRTRTIFIAAALVASTAGTYAQQNPQAQGAPPTITIADKAPGAIDVGVRATSVSGDAARYQRYRDLRDGAFVDRLRWERQTGAAIISLGADHVGYRDQRFFAKIDTGKLKITGLWDQIPLFFSEDTRSLYTQAGTGILRIDDAIRSAAQANILNIRNYVGQATSFDTRSRRDTAEFGLVYRATKELDLKFNVKSPHKEGTMPFGASFGLYNTVEVALPIDHRTTDLTTAAEWANRAGSFRVGYFGSWFDNRVSTLVWDNPFTLADSTDTTTAALYSGRGPSRGRMPLAPNSTLHTVDLSGGYRLPARTQISANIAVGSGSQNATLVPHSTNPLIGAPPLDRQTAEAEVRTTTANIGISTRPNSIVSLSARYRLNDYDNRTPTFHRGGTVRFDQVFRLGPGAAESEYFSNKSQRFHADATFHAVPSTLFRVGYGYNHVDRTFRLFETTTENVFRASLDSTGNEHVSIRGVYEFATREGGQVALHELQAVGEQLGMRHYDVANRDRNRASAILMLNPVPQVAISAAAAYGRDDYKESEFGLRDNKNITYSLGFDMVPSERVAFNLSYGSENYETTQNSRNAAPGPQFLDANRNWATDADDTVRTVDASMSLLNVITGTDVTLGYTWNRSKATYGYRLATAFQAVEQLPAVTHELGAANLEIRHRFGGRIALGVGYSYEQYTVEDFALGPQTIREIVLPIAPLSPTGTFLNYVYRPYTAHTAFVRLMTTF